MYGCQHSPVSYLKTSRKTFVHISYSFYLRILLYCPLGHSHTGFRVLHLYAGRTPAMTPQHKSAASVAMVTGPRRWTPLKSHIQSPEGQSKHKKLLDWKKSRLSTQAFFFLHRYNVLIIGHVDMDNEQGATAWRYCMPKDDI